MKVFQSLAMLGFIGCSALFAATATAALQVQGPWIRDAPPTAPMRAGYAELRNVSESEIEVVAASSPDFGLVEMHETRIENGVARMSQLASLKIAPGQTYTFAPGGAHLMLMQPRRALDMGDRTTITLVLKSGERVDATFTVSEAAPL